MDDEVFGAVLWIAGFVITEMECKRTVYAIKNA